MKVLMKSVWGYIVVFVLTFGFVFIFNNLLHTRQLFAVQQKQHYDTIIFIPGLNLHGNDYQSLISKLEHDHYHVLIYVPDDVNVSDYQKLVKEWANGVSKQIGNKQVIVIGHSVGGSVAAYFCSIDKRCVAGINMDGSAAFTNKIPVPFLYLQADTGTYCDKPCFIGRALMEKVATQSGATFIHITGIKHYNFTDLRTKQLQDEDYLGPQDGRKFIYANIKTFLKQLQN